MYVVQFLSWADAAALAGTSRTLYAATRSPFIAWKATGVVSAERLCAVAPDIWEYGVKTRKCEPTWDALVAAVPRLHTPRSASKTLAVFPPAMFSNELFEKLRAPGVEPSRALVAAALERFASSGAAKAAAAPAAVTFAFEWGLWDNLRALEAAGIAVARSVCVDDLKSAVDGLSGRELEGVITTKSWGVLMRRGEKQAVKRKINIYLGVKRKLGVFQLLKRKATAIIASGGAAVIGAAIQAGMGFPRSIVSKCMSADDGVAALTLLEYAPDFAFINSMFFEAIRNSNAHVATKAFTLWKDLAPTDLGAWDGAAEACRSHELGVLAEKIERAWRVKQTPRRRRHHRAVL